MELKVTGSNPTRSSFWRSSLRRSSPWRSSLRRSSLRRSSLQGSSPRRSSLRRPSPRRTLWEAGSGEAGMWELRKKQIFCTLEHENARASEPGALPPAAGRSTPSGLFRNRNWGFCDRKLNLRSRKSIDPWGARGARCPRKPGAYPCHKPSQMCSNWPGAALADGKFNLPSQKWVVREGEAAPHRTEPTISHPRGVLSARRSVCSP